MIKMFFGSLIAAAIAFAWSFVSWMVIPWHQGAMNQFTNQEFVEWVIKENAKKSGVYVLPQQPSTKGDLSPDEIVKSLEEHKALMRKGPLIYLQVKVNGVDPTQPAIYIYSFLTQFIGAFLICLLLRNASDLTYKGRLFFVTTVGLTVGVLGFFPDWVWFGAGWKYTSVLLADITITWFLAGLFLAGFIKEKDVPDRELMM